MRLSSVVFDEDSTVEEQEAQALAINEAIEEQIIDHVESQGQKIKFVAAIGIVLFMSGIGLLISNNAILGIATMGLGSIAGIGGVGYTLSQDPDIAVQSVQKGYWTGYMIPDENGTVFFDATESIQSKEFSIELLENPEKAASIEKKLDSLRDRPVVMKDSHDLESSFVGSIEELREEVETTDSYQLDAPVLAADEPAMKTLSNLAPRARDKAVEAGGVSISFDEATAQVDSFSQFESMVDEDHGESVLLNVSEHSRELANELSGLQETAIGLLNGHVQTAGDMFARMSYNFYCPKCMNDDIQSQLELGGADGEWYCDTCRSNFAAKEGIPRHRIRDEIVLDVWDQLWTEKDDQRREVYESIEDQKAELQEREFEQRREEIRRVEDRIKDIRARIRDLQTEARAKEGIVNEMGELMIKYNRLNEQRKNQFQSDISDSFEEIDEKTEKTLEETEGIIQDRIEDAEKEAKENAELLREEEKQKHKEKMAHQEAMTEAQIEAGNKQSEAQIEGDKSKLDGANEAIAQARDNYPSKRGK